MKDILTIQDEIALEVVNKLRLTLLSDEKAKLAKRRNIDPAAYEEYLKGLNYWWQWSDDGMQNAILHFNRAIGIAPDYAQARAGLALAYITGAVFQVSPPSKVVPIGRKIAQEAIDLDPTFADSYAVLALAQMNFDWDWAGAEKNLKKALELNPNSILALDHNTNLLAVRGRFVEAVTNHKKALELDPLSSALHHDLGIVYWMDGQLDQAIPCFQKALELDRNFHISRLLLAFSYQLNGSFTQASSEFQKLAQVAPELPYVQGSLGYFHAVNGRPAEARKVLNELDELARKHYVTNWARAIIYIGLGEKSAALGWLEKACEEHDGWMWTLNSDPWYTSLRSEPRFQALVRKIGMGK